MRIGKDGEITSHDEEGRVDVVNSVPTATQYA